MSDIIKPLMLDETGKAIVEALTQNNMTQTRIAEINAAADDAKADIQAKTDEQVARIPEVTQTRINEINTAADTVKQEIENKKTDSVSAVESKATECVNAITQKGDETLKSIPEDYTNLYSDVGSLKGDLDYLDNDYTNKIENISMFNAYYLRPGFLVTSGNTVFCNTNGTTNVGIGNGQITTKPIYLRKNTVINGLSGENIILMYKVTGDVSIDGTSYGNFTQYTLENNSVIGKSQKIGVNEDGYYVIMFYTKTFMSKDDAYNYSVSDNYSWIVKRLNANAIIDKSITGEKLEDGTIGYQKVKTNAVLVNQQNEIKPTKEEKGVLSIVIDDATTQFWDVYKDIIDENGIKVTHAVITDFIGTKSYMSAEQLQEIYSNGHQIISHSATHSANIYPSGSSILEVSEETIDDDLSRSVNVLKKLGFINSDMLVIPYGGSDTVTRAKIRKVARRYFQFVVSDNGRENDYICWKRDMFVSNNNLQDFKNLIDRTEANYGWAIVGIHVNSIDISTLTEAIQYAKGKNIKIMTIADAFKCKGTHYNAGDFDKENGAVPFYVGNDGKVHCELDNDSFNILYEKIIEKMNGN